MNIQQKMKQLILKGFKSGQREIFDSGHESSLYKIATLMVFF